jgi:hypothetical protein
MKTRFTVLLLLLLLMSLPLARAELRIDGDTGFVYDSNLSNSDRSSDKVQDWAWRTNLNVAEGLQLTRDFRANFSADLRGQSWDHYEGFSEIGGGVSVGLRYRFGLGREAPWISLENRVGYDRFHETFRSGWDEVLSFRTGFAITDRIAIEGGYTFENFAVPDNFFDVQSHTGNIRAIVDLTSSLQVAVGYAYREGDVISYAVPPRPEIARIAVEREDVATFGPDPLYTGYKLPGRTHAVSASVAYALTKHASIQVDYHYAVTMHDPLEYQNHLVQAKIAISY